LTVLLYLLLDDKMTKEVIYTLLLEGNHYYVGRTNNVNRRYKQHESGKGSVWTSKYKPVRIYNVDPLVHPYQELTTTLSTMKDKGIDLVRGDIFTSEHLSNVQITYIRMSIASEGGLCYVCMQEGHLAKYCPNRHCNQDSSSPSPFDKHPNKNSNKNLSKHPNKGVSTTTSQKGNKTKTKTTAKASKILHSKKTPVKSNKTKETKETICVIM
jgi:hypothetical protein